ncbi:MAG: methylmalonyl-CoA decarboxylase [Methyloprofundus sp.]|nr:methylmalonyl-CoA decarboxylase [Methyloprofundus sp.]
MDIKPKPTTNQPIVLSQIQGYIGTVTMNHGKKRNALSSELVREILEVFDAFEAANVRVIILRAPAGVSVWSAGHNVQEIPVDGSDPVPWNTPFEQLLQRVRDLPMPVIGMIEGSVWGGACDLAICCDMLVATATASFAITPAKLGISYNTAGVNHFLGVLPIHIIKQMLFTAEPLLAEDAYRLGLLNSLVEPEELEKVTWQLAEKIASRAPIAVKVLKLEIQRLTDGTSISARDFEEIQGLRREAYRSQDFKEGISAFFEKRAPVFTGK